jgi:hypothetical protein
VTENTPTVIIWPKSLGSYLTEPLTCKGCKHWTPYPPSRRTPDRGECGRIEDAVEGEVSTAPAVIQIFAGGVGSGAMDTRSDFGCTLWEAVP